MKKSLVLAVVSIVAVLGYGQKSGLKLSGKTWAFCVVDSLVEPYTCTEVMSTFRFKKSGRYVEKLGNGFVLYGKRITERPGTWKLKGTTLEIDPDDLEKLSFRPKSIELVIIDENTFYSPQPDAKVVYWLYKRIK